MDWWRANAASVTFGLTLVLCGIGLALDVPRLEILGVFLLGLVLTSVNLLRRKER